jgi:hypothetical protein
MRDRRFGKLGSDHRCRRDRARIVDNDNDNDNLACLQAFGAPKQSM